jgi:hypothetical protein
MINAIARDFPETTRFIPMLTSQFSVNNRENTRSEPKNYANPIANQYKQQAIVTCITFLY